MTRPITFVAAVFVIVAVGFAIRVPAQQTTSTQTELLTEVRLLRQAIQSLAGSNARVQIVFGRLTLQEQRTASAAKRLDEARAALRKVTQEVAMLGDQASLIENMQSDTRRKPEEQAEAAKEGGMFKRMLEQLEKERIRLVAEESEAAMLLNQEQGRWSDLNRQLEDLERSLTRQ